MIKNSKTVIKKNNAGRPTIYTEELIKNANDYLLNWKSYAEDYEVIPTIEGLALHLKINRDTIYSWLKEENKTIFSDIVKDILALQAKSLVNNGLSGRFTSPITKVMLTKHGYREGIEQSGVDGKDLLALKDEEKDLINKAFEAMRGTNANKT